MLNRGRLLLVSFVLIWSGCSTVNFSANYYTPPAGYLFEVASFCIKLFEQLPLKNKYQIRLVEGADSRKLKGIPAISGQTVLIPKDFVKYVYQNYYDDRLKILGCVVVHEICHHEFGLPSKPAAEHFKTDVKAISLMGGGPRAAEDFYDALDVVKKYWFARKGVAGHALNTTWNAANLASVFVGGPGFFVDWFSTDLDQRMHLIRKTYHLRSPKSFIRSRQKNT